MNFDDRSTERVQRHPCLEGTMCQGKEKISGEGKKAVAEEKQENSKKNKEGLGLEEDEWDLKVHAEEHKKDKASKLCGLNKHLRPFDSSEDEESDRNFKKKKE